MMPLKRPWLSTVSQSASAMAWRSIRASFSTSLISPIAQDWSLRPARSSSFCSQATTTTSTHRPVLRRFSQRRRGDSPQESGLLRVPMQTLTYMANKVLQCCFLPAILFTSRMCHRFITRKQTNQIMSNRMPSKGPLTYLE